MEKAVVIRKDKAGKQFGFPAFLLAVAAVLFLVFMGAHTAYGAEYGLPRNIREAGG